MKIDTLASCQEFVISRTFDAPRDGMTQGWTGTLDNLTVYLANK